MVLGRDSRITSRLDGSHSNRSTPESGVSSPLVKLDGSHSNRSTPEYGVSSPLVKLDGSHSNRATLEYGVSSPLVKLDGSHSNRATLEYGVSSPLVKLDGSHDRSPTRMCDWSGLIELANSLQYRDKAAMRNFNEVPRYVNQSRVYRLIGHHSHSRVSVTMDYLL
jgi:hypothetical protein